MSDDKKILAFLLKNTFKSEYTEYSIHRVSLGTVLPSTLITALAESLEYSRACFTICLWDWDFIAHNKACVLHIINTELKRQTYIYKHILIKCLLPNI